MCQNAVGPLPIDGVSIFGSTRSATRSDVQSCNDNVPFGRGIWYIIIGDGSEMTASTCSEFTNFDAHVSVFSGGCDELGCIESIYTYCENGGWASRWSSIEGEVYYILVTSFGSEEYGNFALKIGSANDFCYAAQILPVDGTVTWGSTINSTLDDVPVCGSYVSSPGVWYYAFGASETMTATTCHPDTDYETEITIYRGGDCDNLECVSQASTDLCGSRSVVTWESIQGEFYFIHVHGYGVGNFGLFISLDNQFCPSAVDLSSALAESNWGRWSESGSTLGASLVDANACGIEEQSPGVWYVVEGGGRNISLSTCSEVTYFSSRISLFTGDCNGNLQCIATNDDSDVCGGKFTFEAAFKERYYILIHGASESESGEFVLFLEEE
jgi:hypothetical protein